jgi:purine-nucleoside phosphorylase
MSTPHINAQPGDFATTVLMPGDPLRARFIAEEFMQEVHEVNSVRNMLGFTGSFNGQAVSVMGSGMGIPSLSIYARELAVDFGVKRIIRVGSCGSVQQHVHMRELVVAMGASTDSNVNRVRFNNYDFGAIADYHLLRSVTDTAERLGLPIHVGNIFSADLFYSPDPELMSLLESRNVLAVEMEAAGLYGLAAEYGFQALAVATVSDHILNGEHLSPEERQTSFSDMIRLTLESVCQGE